MKQLLEVNIIVFWDITPCIRWNEKNSENHSKSGRVPNRGLHPDTPEYRKGVLNDGRLLSVALF
jgi:hypothetical protein